MKSCLQTTNLATIIDTFQIHHMHGSWIHKQYVTFLILLYQNIDTETVDWNFFRWITKRTEKQNTFAIHSPSNTGKSCFIRPLLQLLAYGEVTNCSQFMLQNCMNKDILMWEEIFTGSSEIDKYINSFLKAVQQMLPQNSRSLHVSTELHF